MSDQMEAHHYCTKVNEDLIQCVLYDGNTKDAKMIGIEYVISEKMFKSLPEEEKHLWHSHHYEVKSGTLIAPGLPDAASHELIRSRDKRFGVSSQQLTPDKVRTAHANYSVFFRTIKFRHGSRQPNLNAFPSKFLLIFSIFIVLITN